MHDFCYTFKHKPMKRIFSLILILIASGKIFGQGQVEVIVDPAVQTMEEARIARNKSMGIKVYRIMIAFYPDRSAANDKLSEARGWFGAKYGVIVQFDEPNFKVYVGEFSSKTDAEAALADVRKKYPSARVVNDYAAGNKN